MKAIDLSMCSQCFFQLIPKVHGQELLLQSKDRETEAPTSFLPHLLPMAPSRSGGRQPGLASRLPEPKGAPKGLWGSQ